MTMGSLVTSKEVNDCVSLFIKRYQVKRLNFYYVKNVTLHLELIPGLDAFVFKKAACGAFHTLAINEWGQLFSWGSNSEGQLGTIIFIYTLLFKRV